jgi:4-hydroxy-tetrahydrodipicolinate synthase
VDTVKQLALRARTSSGSKKRGATLTALANSATVLPPAEILSGDDPLTLPFMSVGAQGVISVASNVIPRQVSQMVKAFAAGDIKGAQKLHRKFYPIFKDLFIETNPVPVKAALAMMGLIQAECRLPLTELSRKNAETLRQTLISCGILK